jgi:hypothetical protein
LTVPVFIPFEEYIEHQKKTKDSFCHSFPLANFKTDDMQWDNFTISIEFDFEYADSKFYLNGAVSLAFINDNISVTNKISY